MAQWLRELVAVPEGLIEIPFNDMVAQKKKKIGQQRRYSKKQCGVVSVWTMAISRAKGNQE